MRFQSAAAAWLLGNSEPIESAGLAVRWSAPFVKP